jgi:hypothetical protein
MQLRTGDTVLEAADSGPRQFGRVLLVDGSLVKVQWPGSVGWHQPRELERHPMPSDQANR